MKKKIKWLLVLLIFLFAALVVSGIGVSYAYYKGEVTGAVSARSAKYSGEVQVVSETHSILPASSVAVDEIKFYVKNYTGNDNNPTTSSEVFMSYILNFSLPTWGTGCQNPISYKLYSVNQSTNAETEVTLTNNATSTINFGLISAEKDYYKLKLYWDTTHNDVTCYANKSGNVGISANIFQRNV